MFIKQPKLKKDAVSKTGRSRTKQYLYTRESGDKRASNRSNRSFLFNFLK